MIIYMVASTTPSWMNTGYGHSLLAAGTPELLVSFEEFSKRPRQSLQVTTMAASYNPKSTPQESPPHVGQQHQP